MDCRWAFVVVRRLGLAPNDRSVSWLVVAAEAMFSIYTFNYGSKLVALVVALLAGVQLMVPSVFALLK